jgi:hypothetical protein
MFKILILLFLRYTIYCQTITNISVVFIIKSSLLLSIFIISSTADISLCYSNTTTSLLLLSLQVILSNVLFTSILSNTSSVPVVLFSKLSVFNIKEASIVFNNNIFISFYYSSLSSGNILTVDSISILYRSMPFSIEGLLAFSFF